MPLRSGTVRNVKLELRKKMRKWRRNRKRKKIMRMRMKSKRSKMRIMKTMWISNRMEMIINIRVVIMEWEQMDMILVIII